MQPINRVYFEIPKQTNSSDQAAFEQVIDLTLAWLKSRSFVDDAGVISDLVQATSEKNIGKGARGESIVFEEGERKAWAIRFSHPDSRNSSLRWVGEITVSDKGGPQIFFSNTLGIAQTDERVAPVEVMPSNPSLNREILSVMKGQTRHKHRLFSKPHVLNEDAASIELFVRILENKERSHPMVFITPGSNNLPLVDPDSLAKLLAGMAHVLVASSHEAAQKVTGALPPRLGCQNGGIRIYWPDFHENKTPQNHHAFLDWEVVKFGERLPGKLVGIIARQAVLRMPEEYISWSDLQTASLRQSIENASQASDALELLTMFEAENSRLQQDLSNAHASISKLHETLAKIRQQVDQLGITLQNAATEQNADEETVPADYEAFASDNQAQMPPETDSADEADEEEIDEDESDHSAGLPLYQSSFFSYVAKGIRSDVREQRKGVSNNPPPASGLMKPDVLKLKNGDVVHQDDWFEDEDRGFGRIIELFQGEYYGESTDSHRVWLYNQGKPMIFNGFNLKGAGKKRFFERDVPSDILHLFHEQNLNP